MKTLQQICYWIIALQLFGIADMARSEPVKLSVESYTIPAKDPGIELYVRNKRPADMQTFTPEKTLLYVHGATYPSETAFDLELGGYSWMDYIASRGYDVYLLDLRGYGRSTRPAVMDQPAKDNEAIVRTETAVSDIQAVVEHIMKRRGVQKLNLLGWSWGTTTMGSYAAQHPAQVNKLVLYAPVWLRKEPLKLPPGPIPAYRTVTKEAAKQRWLAGVPADKQKDLIPDGWFEAWGNATFETDAWGMQQNPPLLRAPNGVVYDIQNYWAAGKPLYDPANITAPTLIVHAEWDQDTPAYMSQALFPLLTHAASKRYIVIGEGTHTVIMEKNRLQLFRETQLFLDE
ncbi:MAG: alpha/beta hydrolase [Burkholderiales bacterium]